MTSRFFRSPTSSGSDSSDSEEDTEEIRPEDHSQLDVSGGSSLESIAIDRAAYGVNNSARDWLLSALLEERCYTQVREEHRDRRLGEGEIRREAQRRFQILYSRLAPLDLVSPGLDDERHSNIRQGIRDRLDSVDLSRSQHGALQNLQRQQPPTSLPAPLRRLLTDGGAPGDLFPSWHGFSNPAAPFLSHLDSMGSFSSQSSARYSSDFEELGLLGKGGYGEVFHVKHRLDGRAYAVKKVPIRPHMLARIATEGERAMDEILSEVRSLSRLDHPNVVRYFSSWIEWSTKTGFENSSSDLTAHSMAQSPQVLPGADFTDPFKHPLQRVRTESETANEEPGIMFESVSNRSVGIAFDPALASHSGSADQSLSISGTHLALHMQMDVFPMTLADFITPRPANNDIAPLCHCFHFGVSLKLLQAILEGVEYLHTEKVVHRDLKPANIFLKHEINPRPSHSCVDLSSCTDCGNNASPAKLSVCIGDFGLVTNIADTAHHRPSSAVGTEIYRPAAVALQSNSSPGLDIFATGIIACELLHKFETQMERRSFLQELRHRRFPKHFATCAGRKSAKMAGIVADMLQPERVTIAELKERLALIASDQHDPIAEIVEQEESAMLDTDESGHAIAASSTDQLSRQLLESL